MGPHPLRNTLEASTNIDHTPIIRSTPFSKAIINNLSLSSTKQQHKMSISQTYYLAHQARNKLSIEAGRPAHILRRLVGHANMLDSLMIELADAEQEQERWFNQTVSRAKEASTSDEHPALSAPTPSTKRHIQWADTIVEDVEQDAPMDSSSDSESDSDYDEDVDEEMSYAYAAPLPQSPSKPIQVIITSQEVEPDSDEDASDFEDEDSESGDLALVRTPSHQPPELLHGDEDSDDSDDDSMPPSPEQPAFELTKKQAAALVAKPSSSSTSPAGFFDEGYYLPQRTQGTAIESY
jgi:hypothetical protein